MQHDLILKIPSPYLSASFGLIRCVTHVHAGVGRAGGIVDLPVQRDECGFPCIYSSSLKGALKTALLGALLKKGYEYSVAMRTVGALLGPETGGETFESSVAILDAYLLAMPIRSLKGVYTYVTSPLLLERFAERLELLANYEGTVKIGSIVKAVRELVKWVEEELGKNEAVSIGDSKRADVKISGDSILLVEEVVVNVVKDNKVRSETKGRIENFVSNVLNLDRPLLILRDETAAEVIDRGVVKLTRVRLDRKTKTVSAGPWTEEYLPTKTVLHTLFLFKKPSLTKSFIKSASGGTGGNNDIGEEEYLEALEKLGLIPIDKIAEIKSERSLPKKLRKVAEEVKGSFENLIGTQLRGYLILGGHETIGKGIVKIEFPSLTEV